MISDEQLVNMAVFSEQHVDSIVAEWVEFARTQQPIAHRLSDHELADHARVLLLAVAADVQSFQGAQAAHEKSQGNARGVPSDITGIGRDHAEQRFTQGFSIDHLVSEFRALRASVIRRWTLEVGYADRANLEQLTRFGEAMDEALAASVSLYASKVDDARNLLLGILGHDLRTPLGVVGSTSEYLLASGDLDARQSEAVARIKRSAHRMTAMVRDILDFTGTALGVPLPVIPSRTNIGQIAEHICSEIRAVHPGAVIELRRSGELTGEWDGARIGQMLSNLIGNAVQHGMQGRAVDVCVTGKAEEVNLRVHNEGTQIPIKTRKTLFAPLRQSASAHDEPHPGSSGLGLGLYIAREIAVAHGGSIEVSSDPAGTVFVVRLPRVPPSQA